jgi:cytochrome c551/c552
MRMLKLAVPAGIVAAGFLFCTTASYGKMEYMKKENLKSCTTCHATPAKKGEPNLSKIGKCYADNDHSLAKCEVPADAKKQ